MAEATDQHPPIKFFSGIGLLEPGASMEFFGDEVMKRERHLPVAEGAWAQSSGCHDRVFVLQTTPVQRF